MLIIMLLVTLVTLWALWTKWRLGYWERLGVPGPEPTFFVGNIGETLNFKQHVGTLFQQWYK